MTIKEFFKPNLLKIITIFIVLIISFLGGGMAGIRCDFSGCHYGLLENAMIIIGFIPFVLAIITNTSFIGLFIFSLIYSYILGCIIANFIIFIYKRFRK